MTTPKAPEGFSAMRIDTDATWAVPAMELALDMAGEMRRKLPEMSIDYAASGVFHNADDLRRMFEGGPPKDAEALKAFMSRTFSLAAFALAVGKGLLEMEPQPAGQEVG